VYWVGRRSRRPRQGREAGGGAGRVRVATGRRSPTGAQSRQDDSGTTEDRRPQAGYSRRPAALLRHPGASPSRCSSPSQRSAPCSRPRAAWRRRGASHAAVRCSVGRSVALASRWSRCVGAAHHRI